MIARRSLSTSRAPWLACIVAALGGCGGGGGSGDDGPTVTLSADRTTVPYAQATRLTWNSSHANGCTASGNWGGALPPFGEAVIAAYETATYTITCQDRSGRSAQASVTVTVLPLPSVNFTATPRILRLGVTSHLAWSSTGADSCEASGDWTGPRPSSGDEVVGPFDVNKTYLLACTGAGGRQTASVTLEYRSGLNAPPIADAGADRTAISTTIVELDGSSSSDDSHQLLASYNWTQTSGPGVVLSPPDSRGRTTFVAPTVTADTNLTFNLTVTDDEGLVSAPDTVSVTVEPIPPDVTVRGAILYESIPHGGPGLDYRSMSYATENAEVLVEALDPTTQVVIASGYFAGQYEFVVPSQRTLAVRVSAQTVRQAPLPLPHWQVEVRDLDQDGNPLGPVYSYATAPFDSGTGGIHDIRIPSGWDNLGHAIGPRDAAPFAVLAAIQLGFNAILDVEPDADFPPLTIDWAPTNVGEDTFYSNSTGAHRIVLAGEADVDTQEYDPDVILHEFGHYLVKAFSRNENPGGAHAPGDRLDMRTAVSEGLATALSGIARQNPIYRDSFGPGQHNEGFFNIDRDADFDFLEGWYSEGSAQEIIWDLYDGVSIIDDADPVSIGFQPIWEVLRGTYAQSDALTSIFSFITALKQQVPAQAAAIDTLVAGEQIVGPTMDAFGSTETNDAGSSDVLPIYTNVPLGGSVTLLSTNKFGTLNALSNHRFLRLSLPAPTNVRIDVTAAGGRDPDVVVFHRGVVLSPDNGPANESFPLSLDAGDYVLDVYDCGNAECNSNVAPAPTPITVTVSPN
jgi:hypothetical protein